MLRVSAGAPVKSAAAERAAETPHIAP